MSAALLLALAVALVMSLPTAAAGCAAGLLVERRTRDPHVREAVWTLAFALPLCVVIAAALATLLPDAAARVDTASAAAVVLPAPIVAVAASAAPAPGFLPLPAAAALVAAALFGAALRIMQSALGARRLRRLVRTAQPLRRADLKRLVAALSPPVCVSVGVGQPLLAGLRRPVVLLPVALADNGEAAVVAMVCAHEAAHAARGDNWRLALEAPLAGLFWFNPFVGAARARAWAAREEICDRLATAGATPAQRRRYAAILIDALRLGAGPEPQTAFTGARGTIRMRLKAILSPARPQSLRGRLAVGAAALALFLPVAVAATSAAAMLADDAAAAGRSSVYRYTSRADTAPEVTVTVASDHSEDRTDGVSVAYGDVRVQARNAPAGMIQIDGRPQPAGLDPGSLKLRIERVERREVEGQPPVVNIVTEGPADGGFISQPEWLRRPGGVEVSAVYPESARRQNASGGALITCSVTTEGLLAPCKIEKEFPAGLGFGEAALALAPAFALRPPQAAGARIRLPIMFSLPQTSGAPVAPAPRPSPPGRIGITSDAVLTSPRDPSGSTVAYAGRTVMSGRVGGQYFPVTLDGRTLPEGFDLASIDWSDVRQVNIATRPVRGSKGEGDEARAIDIVTWRD